MSDLHNLQRFVEAQSPVYEQVLEELRAGEKHNHWMWFVFPQIEGLGHSPMARKYAIHSKSEARAYLEHALLGARLRECVAILLGQQDRNVLQIFGELDAMKLRSSLTLFSAVAPAAESCFADALEKFYRGEKETATVAKVLLS